MRNTNWGKFGDKVILYNIRKFPTKLCNKHLQNRFFHIMKKMGEILLFNFYNYKCTYITYNLLGTNYESF